MDSLVLSSLVPLSGEGILQEHVEPRNTHLCSVFSTLFAVRKNPLEKTGLPNLEKKKQRGKRNRRNQEDFPFGFTSSSSEKLSVL